MARNVDEIRIYEGRVATQRPNLCQSESFILTLRLLGLARHSRHPTVPCYEAHPSVRETHNEDMQVTVSTRGFTDVIDISDEVRRACESHEVSDGVAHLFVVGSTAALSTIEYEPGAIEDFKDALERVVPMDADYKHNEAWHDGNGYAHVRAALMKPSLSIPIVDGRLLLGTWQQIILIDFDNRPRKRTIHVQVTRSEGS